VSADAQEKPEPGNPAIKSIQQAAYRAIITLGSGYLESQGRQLRLVPGMQVNAEKMYSAESARWPIPRELDRGRAGAVNSVWKRCASLFSRLLGQQGDQA
jgi:hypothetical protein